jgi:HEPN domain-containing protein
MLDYQEFRRWQQAAKSAREAAELQSDRPDLAHWACFMAEQAAQLAVKGLLHGIGAGLRSSDPVGLGQHLTRAISEPLPGPVAAALQRLSRHYIPPRYPDAHPSGPPGVHYGPGDAEQALADLTTVAEQVEALWTRLESTEDSGK